MGWIKHAWIIALFAAAGCGEEQKPSEPRIDGSSKEALEQSAESIKRSMNEEARLAFEAAMARLVSLDSLDAPRSPRAKRGGNNRKLHERLHGMTADEVVLEAERAFAAHLDSNEAAAIKVLRNLKSAQRLFQSKARADENNNGVGEYGTFGEMSGHTGVRGGNKLNPPLLSPRYSDISAAGTVGYRGYIFAIYLPGAAGAAVAEAAQGGASAAVDSALCETAWCAYAWPANYGETGKRTLFINQDGDIFATESPAYSAGAGPVGSAAFTGSGDSMTGRVAAAGTGSDGNTWSKVE